MKYKFLKHSVLFGIFSLATTNSGVSSCPNADDVYETIIKPNLIITGNPEVDLAQPAKIPRNPPYGTYTLGDSTWEIIGIQPSMNMSPPFQVGLKQKISDPNEECVYVFVGKSLIKERAIREGRLSIKKVENEKK